MSNARVYVETTIPSFYHETRTAPGIVARREWTRQWWAAAMNRYELVTSPAVLDELAAGPAERSPDWLALVAPNAMAARIMLPSAERSPDWLALVAGLPVLLVEPAIAEIVQTYIQHKVMPADLGW